MREMRVFCQLKQTKGRERENIQLREKENKKKENKKEKKNIESVINGVFMGNYEYLFAISNI